MMMMLVLFIINNFFLYYLKFKNITANKYQLIDQKDDDVCYAKNRKN